MRKIILLSLFWIIANTIFAITKVYIPKNGKYVLSGYKYTGNSSINSCLNYLGYRKGKFYFWMTPDESITICFKILSSDIICVISDYDFGSEISKEKVARILNDNGFDYSKEYDAYYIEEDLKEGIKGKYLTLSFIENATHVKAVNNKITDNLNGYEYSFKNGIMVSYKSIDGYNVWAKGYMNKWWFSKLKEKAETKFSNKQDIIAYINMQCDYCADSGESWLYDSIIKDFDYNFGLMCIHYNYDNYYVDDKRIFTISEFNKIVENEAINISKNSNYSPIMLYKKKKYIFNFEDKLIRIEKATDDEIEDNTGEIVWRSDDKPAEYPGGMDALLQYITKNQKYSDEALNKKIQGAVKINFIVNENGIVINPVIIEGIHPDLDSNALEIVKSLKFNPAIHKGHPIETNWTIPIRYRLQ